MCLAQQGTSAFDQRWPLFVEVLVGNWEPPMIAYPSALIAHFGDGSIGSFRLFAALVVLATIAGVFLLGRELADAHTGVLAALLASLAPWSFMAGRLFWKCPLAPMFVVWGVYAFVVGLRTRSLSALILSAISFALSLYSYQSSWAQAPLMIGVLLLLGWFKDRGFLLRAVPAFLATLVLACLPLAVLVLSGGFMKRASDVSVFADGLRLGLLRFGRNYLSHFDPRFLFWSGDANLRHGVGGFGQLSWVDLLAWIAGAWALLRVRRWITVHRELGFVAIAGTLTGAVAAALSNEGIPHALRANGMWPFLALFGAWLMAQVPNREQMNRFALAVATIFLAVFSYHHLVVYPDRAQPYFSDRLGQLARSEEPDRWRRLATEAQPVVARYYLMRDAGMRCHEAGTFIDQVRKEPR